MKKKRMELMLKKLEKAGEKEEKKVDWDGKEGERKIVEITNELRQYYKENKDFKKGGSPTIRHKSVNSDESQHKDTHRNGYESQEENMHAREDIDHV